MKDYYLFPKDGSSIKVEKNRLDEFLISFNEKNQLVSSFSYDKLVKELEDLLIYLKKYGK